MVGQTCIPFLPIFYIYQKWKKNKNDQDIYKYEFKRKQVDVVFGAEQNGMHIPDGFSPLAICICYILYGKKGISLYNTSDNLCSHNLLAKIF